MLTIKRLSRLHYTLITIGIITLTMVQIVAAQTGEKKKIFIKSHVRIGFFREAGKNEKGWQPMGGLNVETEEGESGVTNDKWGYVDIPVYTKKPFELIKIMVEGNEMEVPTFGDQKGIKGGWGSLQVNPEGKVFISTNTCPDVYKLLKEKYDLDTVSGNPPDPEGECTEPK